MSVETQNGKLKLGLYWAAACGGCDIAIVELREKFLDLAAAADILFWPCATDFKYADVVAMPDRHLDVCLFNGAIRNAENEHLAHLLRQKSKVLVAFGSCAHEGCIPGLANLYKVQTLLDRVYIDSPSVDNPRRVLPQATSRLAEGEVTLPGLQSSVRTLAQVVSVDYIVPGCPPQAPQIWSALQTLMGDALPPKGSVLGVADKTVCDECRHRREERRIKRFYRPHEIIADSERCLFDQGIVCAGPATRGGCGALCLNVNMPCRGCYGPPPGCIDQGAALLSAVSSVVDAESAEEAARILDQVVDPAGTFYRFGLPASLLRGARV
jgi:F420-non-reducing hydrogenase small subunit